MPWKTWSVGEEMQAADFTAYIANQVVAVFADNDERNSQLPVPGIGQLTVLETRPEAVSIFNGTGWVDVAPYIQFGESVVTTEAGGGGSVTFPTPFALPPAVITLTDQDVDFDSQLVYGVINAQKLATSFGFIARRVSDGSLYIEADTRVGWTAIGVRT